MRKILIYLLDCALRNFRSRVALQLEVIVLRHQLEVLQRTRPARARLTRLDRILWVLLYRLWPRCLNAVVIVKPATVIAWLSLLFIPSAQATKGFCRSLPYAYVLFALTEIGRESKDICGGWN